MKNLIAPHQLPQVAKMVSQSLDLSGDLMSLPRADQQALFVAKYIACWLTAIKCDYQRRGYQENLKQFLPELHFLTQYRYKGVSDLALVALNCWMQAKHPLFLTHSALPASEILSLQAEGKRVVCCIIDPFAMQSYVLGERDPLSFCLHDLHHAHHFFSQPELYRAQVGFSKLMKYIYVLPLIQKLKSDQLFMERFHYIVSDMNAHPFHLIKTLCALLSEYDRWTQFIECLEINKPDRFLFSINTKLEDSQSGEVITHWLANLEGLFQGE